MGHEYRRRSAEAGDQVFTHVIVGAGSNPITFAVPATATPTNLTFARFRLSLIQVTEFIGSENFGEVEDYALEIRPAPVGGVTSFSIGSGSSAGSIALLAGVVAALVAIAAGGWYTRKRWLGGRS